MDSGSNHLPKFCSRLTFLMEDFLRSTNETRCFFTETCQDLVQLNKCFSLTKSDYTCEERETALDNVVRQEVHQENKFCSNSTCKINNQHTLNTNKIIKLPPKKGSSIRTSYSCNQPQNQKILSGVTCKHTCPNKRVPARVINVSEHDRSCITDVETNFICDKASATRCSDRCFTSHCNFFSLVEHSTFSLRLINLFKNNNSYLIDMLTSSGHPNFVKNSKSVRSDSNVENCSSEKSFLSILSFVNASGLTEGADPVVKLLCETQSVYLTIMEIINNEELKLDYLLRERIICLERRFLHLLNISESAPCNAKNDKKQRGGSFKNRIIWKSVEFWNQSCANEVQALLDKPYVQYKSRSEWEKYQKRLQVIQQKKMQLLILETLISDFLPELPNLDPNSPNTHFLLTIAFTLTSIDKYSVPLLIKV